MRGLARIVVGFVIMLPGCSSEDSTNPPKPRPRKIAPKRPSPAPASEVPAGPAYFATYGGGLVKAATDGTLRVVPGTAKELNGVVGNSKGDVVAVGKGALYRLRGGKVVQTIRAGKDGAPTEFGRVYLDAKGDLWVLAYDSVAVLSSGKWTHHRVGKKLGGSLRSFAVDDSGKLWLATATAVFLREGTAWTEQKTGAGRLPGFEAISAHGSAIYASATEGLFVHERGRWAQKRLSSSGTPQIKQVLVAPGGTLYVRAFKYLYVMARPDRPPLRLAQGTEYRGHVWTMAVDGADRAWLVGGGRVRIVSRDGTVAAWAAGTLPQLAYSVRGVHVVGGGPKLPRNLPQTGSIAGKITRKGAVLAGANVELCWSPDFVFQLRGAKSPCDADPFKARSKTGADGAFRLERVPLGVWKIMVELPGTAKWSGAGVCCSGMKPSATTDVGTLDLRR